MRSSKYNFFCYMLVLLILLPGCAGRFAASPGALYNNAEVTLNDVFQKMNTGRGTGFSVVNTTADNYVKAEDGATGTHSKASAVESKGGAPAEENFFFSPAGIVTAVVTLAIVVLIVIKLGQINLGAISM